MTERSYQGLETISGIKVGHFQIKNGDTSTGATAILPGQNPYQTKLQCGVSIFNGAGEMTGFHQIEEWGVLETPIVLTNSMGIGIAHQGICQWMIEKNSEIADTDDVILPVAAECDDSFLNDARVFPYGVDEIKNLLESSSSDSYDIGSVGAGTGMISFGHKAGIGTAATKVGQYKLAVLSLCNFGKKEELRIQGKKLSPEKIKELDQKYDFRGNEKRRFGSMINIIATDAPLLSRQLKRLSARSTMALGRLGTCGSHGSGDLYLAFSTAPSIGEPMPDRDLDPFFEALVEITEQSILNSLKYQKEDFKGKNNRTVPKLDFSLFHFP